MSSSQQRGYLEHALGVCSSRNGTNWPLQTESCWKSGDILENLSIPAAASNEPPKCFCRLPTEYQCSQFSLFTPPHGQQHVMAGTTAPEVARAEQRYPWPRQKQGQEPMRNNENHLQSRKLHLLDETLSSNETCLDKSSFITRLFRC